MRTLVALVLCHFVLNDSCDLPKEALVNLKVHEVASGPNYWVGTFSCHSGHVLYGEETLKCRHGLWSQTFPVCTAIGKCDQNTLPKIDNGQREQVRKLRGSVHKYSCNKGFDLIGDDLVYCSGNEWSLTTQPICSKDGCKIPELKSQNLRMDVRFNGAVLHFDCADNSRLVGSQTLVCDGHSYNGSAPVCVSAPTMVTISGQHIVSLDTWSVLTCVTNIATAPGHLVWSVEDSLGQEISSVETQTTDNVKTKKDGFVTMSKLKIKLLEKVPSIVIKCSNEDTSYSATDSMTVDVHYPPENLRLESVDSVAHDHGVTAQCVSSPSIPAAQLSWPLNHGVETVEVVHSTDHGYISVSTVTLPPPGPDHSTLMLRCEATYKHNIVTSQEKHINILVPSSEPRIHFDNDQEIYVGDTIKVWCHLDRIGNPPAQIIWFQDSVKIPSSCQNTIVEDGHAKSEVTINVLSSTPTSIVCEASNDATKRKDKVMLNPSERLTTTTSTTVSSTIEDDNSAVHWPRLKIEARASMLSTNELIYSNSNNMKTEPASVSDRHDTINDIHDIPVADMPHSSEYDYSHFEYVNENFDANWKDTVKYAENYYDYDEDYDEEPSLTEQMENSVLIKKLKEEFIASSSEKHSKLHFPLLLTLLLLSWRGS